MFLYTFDEDISKRLISCDARLLKKIKIEDKSLYMFAYDKMMHDLYDSKFDTKDVFISDRYYT